MNKEQAIIRSEQAKQVLSSDAYQAAWTALHDALMANLLDCKQDDDKARYNAWQAVRIARSLNAALADMIQSGESAANALEREVTRQEKITNRTMRVV